MSTCQSFRCNEPVHADNFCVKHYEQHVLQINIEIVYDRVSRDYAIYRDGEIVAYAESYLDAEEIKNNLRLDIIQMNAATINSIADLPTPTASPTTPTCAACGGEHHIQFCPDIAMLLHAPDESRMPDTSLPSLQHYISSHVPPKSLLTLESKLNYLRVIIQHIANTNLFLPVLSAPVVDDSINNQFLFLRVHYAAIAYAKKIRI